jgi:signal transduction histidine kinase
MTVRKGLLGFLHHRPVPSAGVLAVVLAAVEMVIDGGTWVELNVAILYTLPLVLAAAARNRRLVWGLAVSSVGMTFAVYFVQQGPAGFSLWEPFFVNRVLAAATVLLTAGLLHAWTLALDTLETQGQSLKAQNEQLDAANRELLRCQEEITRQNEELDHRRREAEEASGRKTRLLTSMSHDIRSPLNAINLMAQVIRRTADNPALAAEIPGLAQRLQSNALSLADLVTDVLDIAAFESGRIDLRESEFSLDELLAEECRCLLPLAQAKGLRLAVEPTVAPVWVRADRVKLARVVNNLVTNAIKYTETGGVTLTAGLTPARGVLVRVCDTGVGISPEDLERIFDEFAQLRNPDHDRNKGWGLGLAICWRLLGVMGGTIKVESQPNRGSVFDVHLPPACVVAPGEGSPGRAGCGKNAVRPASL